MKRFLIIQTAFIGDVVLALPLAQELERRYPNAEVHFLLRKGNEGLLKNHPSIKYIHIWDKEQNKLLNMVALIGKLRNVPFDTIFNLHRFMSSGIICYLLKAQKKIGFTKNPFSFCYTQKINHLLGKKGDTKYEHEVLRNLRLLNSELHKPARPKLYPSPDDRETIHRLTNGISAYYVIAPASVWHTKQLPIAKWTELMVLLPEDARIYLIGSAADHSMCDILEGRCVNAVNMSGKLSFLESAALMENAQRVFANDSAPLHFASAMNAKTTAVFCSTVPEFGFGPLSDKSQILQSKRKLECKPCGIHGKRQCPLGHFDCANTIDMSQALR